MSGQKGSDGAGYSEYTLKEVIGIAVLSDWARCVAVDSGGEVWEYSKNQHSTWAAFGEEELAPRVDISPK